MAENNGRGILGEVFDLGKIFAVPLAQRVIGGATGADLIAERNADNRLNGSGPNDPRAAVEAPASLADFIAGPTGERPAPPAPGNLFQLGMDNPILVLLLVGALALVHGCRTSNRG
jgi:hypothetical protein